MSNAANVLHTQVSCAELDRLVELCMEFRMPAASASEQPVLGARMTGGGFGGCVVALVRTDALDALQSYISVCTIASN